jgi:hypothetical protein
MEEEERSLHFAAAKGRCCSGRDDRFVTQEENRVRRRGSRTVRRFWGSGGRRIEASGWS